MKLSVALPLLALAVAGCSKPASPPDRPPPAPPPPLSEGTQQAASQRGRAIAAEAFSLLSSNLQAAIQTGGISNALPFCSLAASPLTATLGERHGVTIRRVTQQARNPANKADSVELAVLESFASALRTATNPPPPLVTNLAAGQVSFFAPILLSRELCLKCHGSPVRDIAASDLAVIRGLYPHDEATGFSLGQLRGAWRIDFPTDSLESRLQP